MKRKFKDGEFLVILCEGPKGGPGMREMLSTTAALYGLGVSHKITIDAVKGRLSVALSDKEMRRRRMTWRPRKDGCSSGTL